MQESINTFKLFFCLAEKNDNIRAALLTSSRANNNAKKDFLSDYDIELYVKNIEIIEEGDEWIASLGPIMTRWPLYPRATLNQNWITRLFLFENGTRIDLQITSNINERLKNIDYGYRVLIDKDNILNNLPEPTHSQFNIQMPTKDEYEILVNDFWWDATYVPKYLWRDELPSAKAMMGRSVHDKLLIKIIEWYIGFNNNWNVSAGIFGRHFKTLLEQDLWEEYLKTLSGADIEDNWNSFFASVDLFTKLARKIGKELGYDYPDELENKMRKYYLEIKNNENRTL